MITNFIDNNTVITASWLNKVDRAVSEAIGQGTDAPTTPVQVKQNLGLDNVDNTSDLNKPVSTATQAALDAEVAALEATDLLRVPRDSSTGAASIPTGTTAQRPVSPTQGMLRRNSQLGQWEGYNGSSWDVIPDTSGVATLTGTQTIQNKTLDSTNNISGASGHLAGFRNKIINGAFQVWQRGTTQSTAGFGSADRWFFGGSGFTVVRGQDVQPSIPSVTQTGEYCLITGTSSSGSYFQQAVEGVRTFANTTCVLSYYYTLISGTDTGGAPYFRQYFGSSGSAPVDISATSDTSVSLGGSMFRRTLVFTLPSIAGKTISGGNDALAVIIPFIGTFQKAYFGIQLEAGSIATPFEHRPYGLELALCQRYLPALNSSSTSDYFSIGQSNATNNGYGHFDFLVTPRIPPTGIMVSNPAHFTVVNPAGATMSGTSVTFSTAGYKQCRFTVVGAGGLTTGQPCEIYFNNINGKILFTGCEL